MSQFVVQFPEVAAWLIVTLLGCLTTVAVVALKLGINFAVKLNTDVGLMKTDLQMAVAGIRRRLRNLEDHNGWTPYNE
jgi:hypothetical protein